MTPTLVIGIGNAERGDDAAGIEVARRLAAHPPRGVLVRECSGEASGLLESWSGQSRVILVDAARGSGPPGGVHRLLAHRAPLPAALLHSTHSWGVAEAVELARSLGLLPACVLVYAIEGESFDLGRPLSPAVRRAVELVERQVREEVGGIAADRSRG